MNAMKETQKTANIEALGKQILETINEISELLDARIIYPHVEDASFYNTTYLHDGYLKISRNGGTILITRTVYGGECSRDESYDIFKTNDNGEIIWFSPGEWIEELAKERNNLRKENVRNFESWSKILRK
jgi:hypothetical protein